MSEAVIDKSAYGTSKMAQWGVADRQLTSKEKWISFIVMYVFGIGCVYQYMMITPILPQIVEAFGSDMGTGGLMMSVFSIIGLIIAYPATWIMHNVGVKVIQVATGVFSILGTLLCIFAGDMTMMLIGRTLQGCAFCLMCVIGPEIVTRLFPMNQLGMGMGIFAIWFPIGFMIATYTVPILFGMSGWTAPFWVSLVWQVILVVLIVLLFKLPLVPENLLAERKANEAADKAGKSRRKIYFAAAVIVGLTFIGYEVGFYSYNDFYATFLQTEAGWSIADASMPTFICMALNIPFGIVAGVIADKTKRNKELLIVSFIILAVCFVTIMFVPDNTAMIWACAVILGVTTFSIVPVSTRVMIPILCPEPKKCDWALTGMTVGTTLGGFGAGFFPMIVEAMGSYQAGGMVIAVVPIAMAVIMLFIKSDHKIWEEEQANQE